MSEKEKRIEERIEELKQRAQELAGGEMTFGEAPDVPPEISLQFWENVVAFEEMNQRGGEQRPFDVLQESGVSLPPPDELDDKQLSAKLWEVIRGLELLRIFLERTDHLSDRELYAELWGGLLKQKYHLQPGNRNAAWHLDMIGGYSEEDIQIYLQYYADEIDRQQWASDWPEDSLPQRKPLPYDRDRLLPKPHQGRESGMQ